MSILVKAGTGLAAGIVAGALGLAFFPRVEPTALKTRNAVEKPQFVAAAPSPAGVAANRAAPAVAIASEAAPEKPAKPAEPEPKVAETKPTPVALASFDPPKAPAKSPALGESRGLSFAALPSPTPSPLAAVTPPKPAEVRATAPAVAAPQAAPQPAPATASDESARWSVRGLLALAKGDLSSARLYLSRAADAGDPRALVALADTYDPAMLTKLGVVVAPGDAQKAKDLLVKAAAAGVLVAKDRMAALDVR